MTSALIATQIVGEDLAARLARWRAAAGIDDEASVILFGVGLATIERIERGEVEPEPGLRARILRAIAANPEPIHSPPVARPSGEARGASADVLEVPVPRAPHLAHGPGAAASVPPAAAALLAIGAGAWLARRDGGGWDIHLALAAGDVLSMTIDEARRLTQELQPLIDIHDNPDRFEGEQG